MKIISKQILQILYCHLQFLLSQLAEDRKKFLCLPTQVLGFHLRNSKGMRNEVTDQILACLFPVFTLEEQVTFSFLGPRKLKALNTGQLYSICMAGKGMVFSSILSHRLPC